MKYMNLKTLTLMLSASALLALTGCGSSGTPSESQLVGDPVNQPPVANAGADRTIVEGTSFTLNGVDSFDPDGEIVMYEWSSEGVIQEGVTVTFDNVPYREAPYIITLKVTDNDANIATDTVSITVVSKSSPNLPPVADAKTDKVEYTCGTDTAIRLLGNGSTDDGNIQPLSFAWSGILYDGSEESSIKDGIADKNIVDTNYPITTLCDPEQTSYSCMSPEDEEGCLIKFTLSVNDGEYTDDSYVEVRVHGEAYYQPPANIPPVALAGPDQTIGICDALIMDGTGSSDEDGSIVTYVWTVGDGAIILGEGPTPTLTLAGRTPGEHDITLTVTDNEGATDSDIVTVTVTGADEDYDYSLVVGDPTVPLQVPYLTVTPNNAKTYIESTFRYWATTTTNSSSTIPADPGIVDFTFNFPGNIEIAYLYASITTFHFDYSAGSAYLFASNGGAPEQLLYAVPPAINGYNTQRYNDFLDEPLIGTPTLGIQAELHADGSSYALTAQFLRWMPDQTSFKLNVCYEGEEVPY